MEVFKMFDKDNIMRVDYVTAIGNHKIEMVALYNKKKITEEEVMIAVELDGIEQNKNIIFMTREQHDNVFMRSVEDNETKKDYKYIQPKVKEIIRLK